MKLARHEAKAKQHPKAAELLTKMSKETSEAILMRLMINCNENENNNEK